MLAAYGLGDSPPAALLSMLYRETDGNPFFVEEVIRHLREQGKLLTAEHGWLPASRLATTKCRATCCW